jgi:hypothetical protein
MSHTKVKLAERAEGEIYSIEVEGTRLHFFSLLLPSETFAFTFTFFFISLSLSFCIKLTLCVSYCNSVHTIAIRQFVGFRYCM